MVDLNALLCLKFREKYSSLRNLFHFTFCSGIECALCVFTPAGVWLVWVTVDYVSLPPFSPACCCSLHMDHTFYNWPHLLHGRNLFHGPQLFTWTNTFTWATIFSLTTTVTWNATVTWTTTLYSPKLLHILHGPQMLHGPQLLFGQQLTHGLQLHLPLCSVLKPQLGVLWSPLTWWWWRMVWRNSPESKESK